MLRRREFFRSLPQYQQQRAVKDPGLGFSKTAEQNWRLLAGLERFEAMGYPVLVGASRKAFLGRLLADEGGNPRLVSERESAHTALVGLLAQRKVWCLRVYDVRAARDALAVVGALAESAPQEGL